MKVKAIRLAKPGGKIVIHDGDYASLTFDTGNPDLDPERSESAELGLGARVGKHRVDAFVFTTETEDLIDFDFAAPEPITATEEAPGLASSDVANPDAAPVRMAVRAMPSSNASVPWEHVSTTTIAMCLTRSPSASTTSVPL